MADLLSQPWYNKSSSDCLGSPKPHQWDFKNLVTKCFPCQRGTKNHKQKSLKISTVGTRQMEPHRILPKHAHSHKWIRRSKETEQVLSSPDSSEGKVQRTPGNVCPGPETLNTPAHKTGPRRSPHIWKELEMDHSLHGPLTCAMDLELYRRRTC